MYLNIVYVIAGLCIHAATTGQRCDPVSSDTAPCDEGNGWVVTSPPETCMKYIAHPMEWLQARQFCQQHVADGYGDQFSAIDDKQYSELVDFVKLQARKFGHTHVWLGVSSSNSKYEWTNGLKADSYNPSKQPRTSDNGCVKLKLSDNSWQIENCSTKLPFVCQKESRLGPRELKIKMTFDNPGRISFIGHPMKMTCSAFLNKVGDIYWTANKMITPNLQYKTFTQRTTTDVCAVNTTLTFDISNVTKNMKGLYITCFNRKANRYSRCGKSFTPLAFCAHSKPFLIREKPKSRPKLTVDYEGSEGWVQKNTNMTVTCRVYSGDKSQIVMGYKLSSYITKMTPRNDVFKNLETQEETDDKMGRIQKQMVTFRFTQAFSDISFYCYGIDVFTMNIKTECQPSSLFCVKTGKFKVGLPKKFQAYGRLYLYALFWILLSLLVIICPAWFCLRRKEQEVWEEAEGEYGYMTQVTTSNWQQIGYLIRTISRSFSDKQSSTNVDPKQVHRTTSTTIY